VTLARFAVGDRVVCPGVQVAKPVGVVQTVYWAGIVHGWMYAVRWDEGPDGPRREVGKRRNEEGGDKAVRWQERQLAPADK